MIVDEKILQEMLQRAETAERKRFPKDMRTSENDTSQRMLNAMLPGTKIDVHRHRHSAETIVLLKGDITEVYYDDNGNETARISLREGCGEYLVQVPKNVWHTTIVNKPSVIFSVVDGAYQPLSKADVLDI
ncbi:MAG: cupin fold metalloprotein, WbuC family [Bacteroidales bacterium]|nr:cupin fold metalloprotein, WbuC family [Bacteroidales bacterium]